MSAASREQEAMWAGFKEAALGNLAAAFENVGPRLVAGLADDIRSRNHVYVAGARTSHWLAGYLHRVANMASPSFCLVHPESGEFVDDVADMSDRDALICLSSLPSAGFLGDVARIGRERGALVITIAHDSATPLAALSDHLLVAPQHGASFFQSHVAVLALVEALVGLIALGEGPAATNRIERIEADRLLFERLRKNLPAPG